MSPKTDSVNLNDGFSTHSVLLSPSWAISERGIRHLGFHERSKTSFVRYDYPTGKFVPYRNRKSKDGCYLLVQCWLRQRNNINTTMVAGYVYAWRGRQFYQASATKCRTRPTPSALSKIDKGMIFVVEMTMACSAFVCIVLDEKKKAGQDEKLVGEASVMFRKWCT